MASILDLGADWRKIKHAGSDVGHAVGGAASDVGHFFSNDVAKPVAHFVSHDVAAPVAHAAGNVVNAVEQAPQAINRDVVQPVYHQAVQPVFNLPQTVNNDVFRPIQRDVFKPIQRDVFKPVASFASELPSATRTVLESPAHIPLPGGITTGDFVRELPEANFKAFSGAGRSAIGTAQGLSGLYDMASQGTLHPKQTSLDKGLNNLAKGFDTTAKQYNVNPIYYHGSQLATDLGTFALPGAGEAKIAAKVGEYAPKVSEAVTEVADHLPSVEKGVAKLTSGLDKGNFGQRVAGRAIRNVANPKYQAANAAFTGLQAGKQASDGEGTSLGQIGTNLAIGGVGFPVAGAVGGEIGRGAVNLADRGLVEPLARNTVKVRGTPQGTRYLSNIDKNGNLQTRIAPKDARRIVGHEFGTASRNIASKAKQFSEAHPMSLSIQDVNGVRRVAVDKNQHIFDGKPATAYPRIARDFLNKNFKGKTFTADEGGNIHIGSRGIGKYTAPNQMLDATTQAAKMRLAPELDNAIKVSKKVAQKPDIGGRHGNFAKDGFTYHNFEFEVGGQPYRGTFNVGKNGEINNFYDVHPIKKLPKGSSRSGLPDNGRTASPKRLTDNSIPKSAPVVKSEAKLPAKSTSPREMGRALGLSDKQMADANVADSQRARLENPVSKKIRLEEQSQAEQLKAPQSQPTAKVTPRPEKPLQADQGEQQSGNTLKSHTQKHPDSSQNQKGRSSSGGKYTTNATKVNIAEVKPGDYEKVRSNAQLVQTMVHNHAQSVIHALRQLPKSERDSFWNSVENPKLPRSAKMQTAINRWQRLANTVHATSQALGGDTPYLANYARHNWDLSDPAQRDLYEQLLKQKVSDTNYNPDAFSGLDNKPRLFSTIKEGQAAGFRLKNANPIDDIVDYANKSKRQLKTQAVAKGMQEAEENVPLADKSETQTIGYKKSIETTKQGVKELRSLFPPPKSGNKTLKGYRSFNHTAKRFLLGISQFHPININMQAAPALALRGHPIRAVRGLIDSAAALNKRYSDKIMENALKDGTLEDAGRIGTPIATGSDFATGNKVDLKAGFGERAVFERQLPAMHVQMVRGVVADLKKRGISLDSPEARKAGTEINQIMGYVNTELRNLSPTVQRGLGDVALAPQFTRSKWEVLRDAFDPRNLGTVQSKYARNAVVGKYAAEAGITLALGALLGQKSDNITDILIRTLIHPAVPTPFKDKKGNTIELGLPQNYLSEAAGLGLNYTRGKNGHLSISASPSGIPGNLKDYGKNRLALIPNDALKIATNTDFADKPLYNPTSSSGDKIAQTLATLGVGHLPIGLQGLAYTKAVNKHLPQNVQDVLNNASPGSNPILKSVGSSFGLNPRTDKTVGKGLSTTRYFDALDNAKKGLNSRELAAIGLNTDSKKNPVTGKYNVTPNVNDSRAKATALLDQPKAFNALYKMNQALAKEGENIDPLWKQSPDKVKSYLAYQAMAPGSADKSDWYNKNKFWYQPVAAARSTFFNSLPPGDPNKPQLASQFTYPTKPKSVNDYYNLKSSNPTAANTFFDNHPEIAKYEDQYAQVTNNWRTAQGYAPFKNYPKASPDVQSFMDNYNAADKATRKSIRNSNPTQYRKMIAYYDALDLYNINKQGALSELQGEPNYTNKSAKAIKNIGEDFYVDQYGNYHLIPAGWMLGLGGDGYGSNGSSSANAAAKAAFHAQMAQLKTPLKTVGALAAPSLSSMPKYRAPALRTVYRGAAVNKHPTSSLTKAKR